ncbi:hypothetical protein N7535_007830 [Penicillium sp. DV-2018c]|nr:hypothetical protein N7535_007830 [Penicillium sp. DV-2018c]
MSKISKINHAAGIFADISVDGPVIGTLVCVIDRAKNLPNRKTMGKQNPYAAARLGKEAKKTQTDLRGGQTPRWDSELRFTVHESPDYFRLKVSVFNDDKRTDLIGETWVDLQNLIIPGGSQNDHWHPLQYRGKYAGDIRIEMTYYDTRQQDEALIGRRQEAAERVQGRTASTPSSANTGLSGPRQLKDVKRRPLPSGPPGAPVRPPPLEHAQSAPVLHHPVPSRPPIPDHSNTLPGPPDAVPHAPRHSEPVYEAPSHREPSPAPPRSRGGYDGANGRPMEWDNSAVAPLRRHNTHEMPYASNETTEPPSDPRLQQQQQLRSHSSNEATEAPYDPRLQQQQQQQLRSYSSNEATEASYDQRVHQQQQSRGYSDHDQSPSKDYRLARQDQYENVQDPANYHLQQDMYAQQPRYNADPVSYGAAQVHELPASDLRSPSSALADDVMYHQPSIRPLQITARPHDYHPEYAGMQPRVEDEDEDGPPPPPPVHRSHAAQPPLPTPTSSHNPYASYAPQPASRPPVPQPPSTMYTPSSHDRYQEPFAKGSSPAMPASLVAGYEHDDPAERAAVERSVRRRSPQWDDEMMLSQAPVPVPVPASAPVHHDTPVYPLRTSPRPIDQRPTSSRGGSVSPDSRAVTRKSVSPRPTSSDGRGGSSVPFSPDSYISLNPNASHTPSRDPSPAYDSPLQARDAAVRAKVEAMRDAETPIIGDDGREIDPSDHLPTDTWAPEPERKNRKPEVIIRFKHSPRPTSRGNDTPPTRSSGPPRVGFRPEVTTYPSDRPVKYTPTHVQASPGSMVRTPPRQDYSRERSDSYAQSRGYNAPTSVDRPRSSRGSVSPSPGSRSPLYDYSPGPPIPNKVPVIGSPSYPVMSGGPNGGNVPMDALSRELSTIDIGSAACSPGRGAVRKYVPRAPASMGYAS